MKIKFANRPLNPNGETPKNFFAQTLRKHQEERAISAAKASIFDRGNESVGVSFSIERAHSSEGAAELFALTHAATLSAGGSANLDFTSGEGSSKKTYTLESAVASKIKITADSLTTLTSYDFVGTSIIEKQ